MIDTRLNGFRKEGNFTFILLKVPPAQTLKSTHE